MDVLRDDSWKPLDQIAGESQRNPDHPPEAQGPCSFSCGSLMLLENAFHESKFHLSMSQSTDVCPCLEVLGS